MSNIFNYLTERDRIRKAQEQKKSPQRISLQGYTPPQSEEEEDQRAVTKLLNLINQGEPRPTDKISLDQKPAPSLAPRYNLEKPTQWGNPSAPYDESAYNPTPEFDPNNPMNGGKDPSRPRINPLQPTPPPPTSLTPDVYGTPPAREAYDGEYQMQMNDPRPRLRPFTPNPNEVAPQLKGTDEYDTQELARLQNNPAVNKDKGFGGRLKDILREAIIGGGNAYNQTGSLEAALGGALAGGVGGGLIPNQNEERDRQRQIGEARQRLGDRMAMRKAQSDLANDQTKRQIDIAKATTEIRTAEIAPVLQHIKDTGQVTAEQAAWLKERNLPFEAKDWATKKMVESNGKQYLVDERSGVVQELRVPTKIGEQWQLVTINDQSVLAQVKNVADLTLGIARNNATVEKNQADTKLAYAKLDQDKAKLEADIAFKNADMKLAEYKLKAQANAEFEKAYNQAEPAINAFGRASKAYQDYMEKTSEIDYDPEIYAKLRKEADDAQTEMEKQIGAVTGASKAVVGARGVSVAPVRLKTNTPNNKKNPLDLPLK